MHAQDRLTPEIVRFGSAEADRRESVDQGHGARGVLERVHDPAVHHVLLRLVRELRLGEEELHAASAI